jgi:hypothetical protein
MVLHSLSLSVIDRGDLKGTRDLHDCIDAELADWISNQRVFFVATAPLVASGHVNLSPTGDDTFCVLGPMEAAYLDYRLSM